MARPASRCACGPFLVAGTGFNQYLRYSQFEVVAGARNPQTLRRHNDHRVEDLCGLISQFATIAEASSLLNVLFRAAA